MYSRPDPRGELDFDFRGHAVTGAAASLGSNGFDDLRMRVTKNDAKLGAIGAVVWMADKIGMAVRTETDFRGNRIVENRKNIQMSALPESLFEIPAGYTKTAMPQGMVGKGSHGR